jgi:hypothetical protein
VEPSEFIQLARQQLEVTVARGVSVPGPSLRELLASGRALRITELQRHPDQRQEIQRFTYRHLLGPGLAADDIALWQASHPHHQLPADLVVLLQQVNGVHLWANTSRGRSYFGVEPIAEWQDAATGDYRQMFERQPEGLLSLSYHENGDYVLFLDTRAPEYRWHDLEDFDRPLVIGRDTASLLSWLWTQRHELDPRAGG